jgi:hypothetical protein
MRKLNKMTETEPNQQPSPPEPFTDELYDLYVEFQRKARAHFMAIQQGDPYREELVAKLLPTKSPDDLRLQLAEMSVTVRQEFVRACRIGFEATIAERSRPRAETEADRGWKKFVELVQNSTPPSSPEGQGRW